MKILLLTKRTHWCEIIRNFILKNFQNPLILAGNAGDPLPNSLLSWEGDYIISFLSPWIIPPEILEKSRKESINFHPAPPKYRGIGCYNFAIYNEESEYGVTCHKMIEKVDSGEIIACKYFPLYGTESVSALKEKSMVYLVQLFYEIIDLILKNKPLPRSNEKWAKIFYNKNKLQELCKITLDMPENEIKKRIHASYFPGGPDYPYIEVNGKRLLVLDYREIENRIS